MTWKMMQAMQKLDSICYYHYEIERKMGHNNCGTNSNKLVIE
jgi:hypothetical protein